MPIEYADLHTRFVLAPEDLTVREVGAMLASVPEAKRSDWYLVASLPESPGRRIQSRKSGGFEAVEGDPPGYAVILPVKELSDALGQYGEVLFEMTLSAVPGLLLPALTMDSQLMGAGRARREWMPTSPRRRLLVLEDGRVIGLLAGERRSGGFGGFFTTLYGKEHKPQSIAKGRITYRCPVDGHTYDFAELIDLATNRLICPNGHVIEE